MNTNKLHLSIYYSHVIKNIFQYNVDIKQYLFYINTYIQSYI